MKDLGTLYLGNYSKAYGINDSGQVTGQYSGEGAGHSYAFLYSGGVMKHLPTLSSGGDSLGAAINNSGQVTGWAVTRDGAAHPFLYSEGTMKDLGTLGGRNSSGTGINESGQVTGSSMIAGSTASHAFLYSGGAMQDLGTLGGVWSNGFDINNAGTVVGASATTNGTQHAFLYDTMMRDLNDFLPPDSGWLLTSAQGINDAGQITGYGTYNGEGRAFLLSPSFAATPEPSAWLLSLTLFGVVGIVARRAGARFHV
jgi:probable HAF family extracellular repeat protein